MKKFIIFIVSLIAVLLIVFGIFSINQNVEISKYITSKYSKYCYIDGQAKSEAVPTSPFATDKHFSEIGHVLESRTGEGLAKVYLDFN